MSGEHADLVVLTDEVASIESLLLGEVATRIADAAVAPVLVLHGMTLASPTEDEGDPGDE